LLVQAVLLVLALPLSISAMPSRIASAVSSCEKPYITNLLQTPLPACLLPLLVQAVLLVLALPLAAFQSSHHAWCGRMAPAHQSALQAQQQQQQQRMAGLRWGGCCCLHCSHCRRLGALRAVAQRHRCR
jgi:hypothetical protein